MGFYPTCGRHPFGPFSVAVWSAVGPDDWKILVDFHDIVHQVRVRSVLLLQRFLEPHPPCSTWSRWFDPPGAGCQSFHRVADDNLERPDSGSWRTIAMATCHGWYPSDPWLEFKVLLGLGWSWQRGSAVREQHRMPRAHCGHPWGPGARWGCTESLNILSCRQKEGIASNENGIRDSNHTLSIWKLEHDVHQWIRSPPLTKLWHTHKTTHIFFARSMLQV